MFLFFTFQEAVDIEVGITDAQARKMAAFLKFEGSKQDDATEQIKRLYALFLKLDATQIEINPFGETPDGEGMLCVLVSWKFLFIYHPLLMVKCFNYLMISGSLGFLSIDIYAVFVTYG